MTLEQIKNNIKATLETNIPNEYKINSINGMIKDLSEKDKAALTSFCADLAKKSGKEINLASDAEILSGFSVTFSGQNASLDYTGEAVAGALASFLRPELAKTVSAVAREQLTNA